MVSVVPSQMPQVRDDITRFCSSGYLAALLDEHRALHGQYELPLPEAEMPWHSALGSYQQRLLAMAGKATLYHVPAQTIPAINIARSQMREHQLRAEDLPADQGLILFDAPINRLNQTPSATMPPRRQPGHDDQHTDRQPPLASVVGVLWGLAKRADGRPGVLTVLWSDTSELADHDQHNGDADLAAKRREIAGLVSYHDEAVLAFGDIYSNQCPPGETAARHDALVALICTWSLMRQPNTCELAPMPRQVRRRFARQGKPLPHVRIVTTQDR